MKDVTDAVSGVRLFVPWGLYATVGEWQFRHNANVDKRRSRYESLQKAIEERQSKVQEMEKELAEADIAESRAKQLKNRIKKEQEWIAQREPRRDSLLEALKEDEAKLENGDPEAMAKLRDEEIPKLKEQIATKRSQGVPDILLCRERLYSGKRSL